MIGGLTSYEALTLAEALRILGKADESVRLAFVREVSHYLNLEKVQTLEDLMYDLPRISRFGDEWPDQTMKSAAWIADQLETLTESHETRKPIGRYAGDIFVETGQFIICDPTYADTTLEAAEKGSSQPEKGVFVISTEMDGGFPVYFVDRGSPDSHPYGIYIKMTHEAHMPLPFEPEGED